MVSLIEHENDGSSLDTADDLSPVSLKIYQDIYHQITGRTEQIRKRYSDNLLIEFSEAQQLHHKIMQLCDVHRIIAKNETITVFHAKERKEQFTSFERFKSYNQSTSSPSVSLVLKYNFSIMLADLMAPQEYVITIRLTSRVALIDELYKEAPAFMAGRMVFSLAARNTAEITVEYADYVIARGFLEAFDEWVDGCNSEPEKPLIQFAQRWSHIIPTVFQLLFAIIVGLIALETIPNIVADPINAEKILRYGVIFSFGFYVLNLSATWVGRFIEGAIDSYTAISYLKLNSGDSKIIERISRKRRKTLGRFVVGCVFTIILGVLSSKIAVLV